MMEKGQLLKLERPIYTIEELSKLTLYEKPQIKMVNNVKDKFRSCKPDSIIFKCIPLLSWLPEYSWKRNIFGDLISGLTVATMHIPQGLAYALLGEVPPVVGLYMAFFPVLMYFVFGTSRHISLGTFAIVCLMTGKVVHQYGATELTINDTLIQKSLTNNIGEGGYNNIEVAATVTFVVALIQLLMYCLHLGLITILLSDIMVNAFTCGAAFHIITSQFKDLFGLEIEKRSGNFRVLLSTYDAIRAVPKANWYAVLISTVACILLILNNELFKPWLSKRTRIQFPIEFTVIILGTCVSYFLDISHSYGVSIIRTIPTGLPAPTSPLFHLMPKIILDAIVITLVSYTITMSMGFLLARKHTYEIRSNQELLALGLCNMFGSFFSCMPVAASLSRSLIQESVGGVTQITSLISSCVILLILLFIGPLFEPLPKCVPASIIVVSLKNMLLQCRSIKKNYKLSKWDALVWIVTFAATVIFHISIGLVAGILISLFSIFVQGYKPYTCLLGVVPDTDIYLDALVFKGVKEIDHIKIFHYSGGLSFANRLSFRSHLYEKTGLNISVPSGARNFLRRRRRASEENDTSDNLSTGIRCIILDLSSLTFIDPSGVEFLRTLHKDFLKNNIVVYMVGCSVPVYETFLKCDKVESKDSNFMFFPTVHDAVLFAIGEITSKNS